MRDRDDRAALHQSVKLFLDRRLDLRIERRGSLVQHQDRCILEDDSSERDALALAARQFDAALADMRVETAPPVPVFEPLDEFESMRLGCGTVLYGNMGGLPGYTAWMLSSASGRRQIAVAATTDELPRIDRAIHRVVEAAFCR